jgi:repressor LexA
MGRKRILDNQRVLRAIRNWIVHHGVAPTVEELRQALGVGSTHTVQRYLQQLQQEGFIDRRPGARGIKLLRGVDGDVRTRPVPVVGVVPAGPLMLAEENLDGWIRLPEDFLPQAAGSQFFLLRVSGDSMNRAEVVGEKIEDGDLVLVRQELAADQGQIVVALIDGEATVKRLARGPDYFVLKPESTNKLHQPIVLDRETLIQGVVCRVLKEGATIIEENGG